MKRISSLARFGTFAGVLVLAILSLVFLIAWSIWFIIPLAVFGVLSLMGVYDIFQEKHSILRNYPVMGHMRFFFEGIRPEIRQYLIESDQDEEPFSLDDRSLVYQRAKGQDAARPFCTRLPVYVAGYSCVSHSVPPILLSNTLFQSLLHI